MPALPLNRSVGRNGDNAPEEVRLVRRRLHELGFEWLDDSTKADDDLTETIRLFQAIKSSASVVAGQDGRIDPGAITHRWLQARNSPRWMKIVESPGDTGWEKLIDGDRHDFGTNWLQDVIVTAGVRYSEAHLSSHTHTAKIVVNDISRPRGGDTTEHEGHETGLMSDLRLPRKDGGSGGITWQEKSEYDQVATRAMLEAFRDAFAEHKLAGSLVFFNDPALIIEGLCRRAKKHDNHMHVQIVAPALQPD
jgi:hypothetical protein